jgi:hypothetical protein
MGAGEWHLPRETNQPHHAARDAARALAAGEPKLAGGTIDRFSTGQSVTAWRATERESMRMWKRRLPAFAVAAALGLSLSACGNSDKPSASIATTAPTVTTKAATSVPNQANVRKNVDLINCAATANGWSAGGTVKNPSSHSATYFISVNFTSTSSSALANASTSVPVPAGKATIWSVNANFNAPILVLCQLRSVATT